MSDNFAQTVKQQADIVRIIGDYVKLRKTGAQNYTGLCPFHKEKSGSFSVNATHNYFYCFGCHEKGDVFTFVMKLDNISFPEAVRAVATKCGIALPKREFSSPDEAREAGLRRQLIDIHEAATQYFEAQLKSPGAARAREYLTGRGVTPETIAKFRIGYAPDDFNDMRDRLKAHFNEEAMRASGLFSSKDQADGSPGQLYARFRKRITFPIANEQGKTIAFTARALDSDEKSGPKYMNSPETALYSKGQVLFNLDKAKGEIRNRDFVLLVEGQMDCISVYMAGIHNVLATSGTAFTEMQVRLLSRFTKQIVVNFDPDTAGANAAEKSIALLTEEGFTIKVVALEDGLDPDRYIRERGIKAYIQAMQGAKRQSDYLIDRARQLFPARTADAKVKAMNFLLPHIRLMPNSIHRDEFAADAAQKLGIDSAILRQELKQAAAKRVESVRAVVEAPLNKNEIVLIRALIQRGDDPARELAVRLLTENPGWISGLSAEPLLELLSQSTLPDNPLDAAQDDSTRAQLARALRQAEDYEEQSDAQTSNAATLIQQVETVFKELEIQYLERRQREIRTLIAEADRRGDQEMIAKLAAEKIRIDRLLLQRLRSS